MPLGRVVIATSDEWIAKLIAEPLTQDGAEVILVATAEEGLAHVRLAPTSVIVVDVGLPDHDGAWLATEVRARKETRTTAVLLLSHPADDMRRVEALRAGADASLLKPFRVEEACQQIAALAALVDRSSSAFRAAAPMAAPASTPPSSPPSVPSLEGNLAELSLPTVLTLLEMERRSGILTVNGVRQTATIELQGGAPTRATLSGADVAPIAVMRRVLRWKAGRFTFRSGLTVDAPDNRRSVAAFLIEAARLDDESPSSSLETIAPPPGPPATMQPEAFPSVPFDDDEEPTQKREEPPSSRRPPRRAPLPAAGAKPPRPDPPRPPPRLQITKPLAVPGIEDLEEDVRRGPAAPQQPLLQPIGSAPAIPRIGGAQKPPLPPRPVKK